MKKNQLLTLFAISFCMTISSIAVAQFGKIKVNTKTVESGTKVVKAATLTDEDVIKMTKEYINWMDEHNHVPAASDKYAIRLKKITAGLTNEDDIKLNFKVYKVVDINAFACADGSVRVFAGLMDLMTDDEIRGVIGHEIGHVAGGDAKDAMRTAYLTSAAKDAAASQGGAVGSLSQSQLGGLAEALVNAQFSQKQESQADEYGFDFLKKHKFSLTAMADAFRKLKELEDKASEDDKGKKSQLFSSHPSTEKRIKKMEKLAKEAEE